MALARGAPYGIGTDSNARATPPSDNPFGRRGGICDSFVAVIRRRVNLEPQSADADPSRRRAVHQPGMRVLPARRPAAQNARRRSLDHRHYAARRLSGTISAGRTRSRIRATATGSALRQGARRRRDLHAAGRRQRHDRRQRRFEGRDREGDHDDSKTARPGCECPSGSGTSAIR